MAWITCLHKDFRNYKADYNDFIPQIYNVERNYDKLNDFPLLFHH